MKALKQTAPLFSANETLRGFKSPFPLPFFVRETLA
jgi:hypothetical protein